MKRWKKFVLWAAGIYLGVMLLTGLGVYFFLGGSLEEGLRNALDSQIPTPVSVGETDFDLGQWFLLRPAVTLRDVSVANPRGFSVGSLLEVREMSARIELLSLLDDQVEVSQFTITEPRLNIERNRAGRTNLETVLRSASKGRNATSEAAAKTELTVDAFELLSGTATFRDRASGKQDTPLTISNINLRLEDFSTEKTCRVQLQARPFGGRRSRLSFEGRAGPYSPKSLPAAGRLSIDLAPSEVPPDYREELLGNVLREPGDGARVRLEASMNGNLFGTFGGEGKLRLEDVLLGRNEDNRIPLEGEAPLKVTTRRLLAKPTFGLSTSGASLTLAGGEWKGNVNVQFDGTRFVGGSRGSISEVQMNELLSAFTSSEEVVFGIAAIPRYQLGFVGVDGDGILNSLSGKGEITIGEGKFAIFDLLDTVEKHMKRVLKGEEASPGQTEFSRFSCLFDIRQRRVYLRDIALTGPSKTVTGDGHFTFEEELDFKLLTDVRGTLASSLGGKPDSNGQPTLRVPVRVRGQVSSPKVRPDIARLALEKATGILDSLFKKKAE